MPTPRPNLLHDLRSLPGAFRVLFVGTFVNRFGSFVFPFLTIFLSRRGLTPSEIGLVLTGFGVGALAASLAGGWFADRFGRRNAIVAGTFAQAVSMMALYFTLDPIALATLTALCGFSGGFYGPAASALVADVVPPERRLTAYAALRLAGNSAFALGTAAGGFLVLHDPFWLFAGDAISTVAFCALAILALPRGSTTSAGEAGWGQALASLRKDRSFFALALAQMATACVFAQYASAYALEIVRRGITVSAAGWQFSPEQVFGLLIGWNGLLITLTELPLTRLTGVLRPRRVMACGYALIGLGFASNVIPAGFGVLAVGMTLFTIGEMLVMPMVGPWIARIAPSGMRGRYMGALGAAWTVGSILGQNGGLWLFATSSTALWGLCALFGSGAAAAILVIGNPRGNPRASRRMPVLR